LGRADQQIGSSAVAHCSRGIGPQGQLVVATPTPARRPRLQQADAHYRAALAAHKANDEGMKLRRTIEECDGKIERYRAALDAGGDPALIAGWISETSAKRETAAAALRVSAVPPQRLNENQTAAIVDGLGGLATVLREAEPRDKAELYSRIGLRMTYKLGAKTLKAEIISDDLGRVLNVCPRGDSATQMPHLCNLLQRHHAPAPTCTPSGLRSPVRDSLVSQGASMTHPAHRRLIPSVPRPDGATVQPRQPAFQRTLRRPLPLAKLVGSRTSTVVYGLCVLDSRGRLAERRIMRALSWGPGRRLNVRQGGQLLIVTADDAGVFCVAASSLLFLPAAVRHWLRLQAGDSVLLAAYPHEGVLVVHPPAVLDQMVTDLHRIAMGGETA
jgi:hypothetical protein